MDDMTDDEIRIGPTADWTIVAKHSYADASVFGKRNKRYFAPLRDVTGSFSGSLDVDYPFDGLSHLGLYGTHRPAFWGRLWRYLRHEPWPTYPLVEGDADVEVTPDEHGLTMSGTFRFTGPVTYRSEPYTKMEWRWHRLCTRLGR